MVTFFLGVLSSLAASLIYFNVSQASARLRWSYPRGIRFVKADRESYLKRIGGLVRTNKRRLFFKGFTGFDLLSSEIVKSALDETRTDDWQDMIFVLTDPKSDAFVSERNRFYTREHLTHLQEAVRQYLEQRLLPSVRVRPGGICGIFLVPEQKNLFNLLLLDDEAFFFLRGFTETRGPAGQVIINVSLSKCPAIVREFVLFVMEYYRRLAEVPGTAVARIGDA